jgi:hypothetical protein
LIADRNRCLAGRLTGRLAFTASTVFDRFGQVWSHYGFDVLAHLDFLPPEQQYIKMLPLKLY